MFESSKRREFQRGLNADKQRAARRDSQLSLRRKQREDHLMKKHRKLTNQPSFYRTGDSVASGGQVGGAMWNGAANAIPPLTDIPKYHANVMQTDNLELNLVGTGAFRRLLSIERDPPTERIVKTGAIPRVIQFCNLRPESLQGLLAKNGGAGGAQSMPRLLDVLSKLQFEAAWVLTNIAASSSEWVRYIVKHGAAQALVRLFRDTNNPEIADQAIWCLGNIIGDCRELKDKVVKSGFIDELVPNLLNLETDLQQNAIWCMSNVFRYNDATLEQARSVAPVLCKLLRDSSSEDMMRDILWSFTYMSGSHKHDLAIAKWLMTETEIVTDCMKVLNAEAAKYEIAMTQLKSAQKRAQTNNNSNATRIGGACGVSNMCKQAMLKCDINLYRPCLRFFGNVLAMPDDELTEALLNAGYLDVVVPWTSHFHIPQRKEIMWSLSNILAGSHQQIERILSRPKLLRAIIDTGLHASISVRREACHCLCNAVVDAISSQKATLVECGALQVLCELLNPKNNPADKTVQVILEALDAFLASYANSVINPVADQIEEHQGLDYLEEMQSMEDLSEDTYQCILNLMKKYWPEEGQPDAMNPGEGDAANVLRDPLAAKIDQHTNMFTFGQQPGNAGGVATTSGSRTGFQF